MWHFGDFLIGGSSLHWSTNPTLLFDFFFFFFGVMRFVCHENRGDK